jgi:hypothetical protein
MMVGNESAQPGLAAQLSTKQEMGWLVAVVLAFLAVHIVAGTIMIRASADDDRVSAHPVVSVVYD